MQLFATFYLFKEFKNTLIVKYLIRYAKITYNKLNLPQKSNLLIENYF